MRRYKNDDPFAPWNDPMYRDDPRKPWNDPLYKNDPFAPWNDPCAGREKIKRYEREHNIRIRY